jgi:hypothetical protein
MMSNSKNRVKKSEWRMSQQPLVKESMKFAMTLQRGEDYFQE